MKISESKYLSIYSFFILVLCVPYIFSSYHGVASTNSPQKPLKFYMQPRHQDVTRFKAGSDHLNADAKPNENSVMMLVNISFGSPPVQQLLSMDTGSEITWIQCASCTKCFKQSVPLYDPSKSRTYLDVHCGSQFCPGECDPLTNGCIYKVRYVDGSGSEGMIGLEQLWFTTSNHGTVSEAGVVYGCGMENNVVNPRIDYGSGVLGLNGGPVSLTTRKGRKFSYCIGNLNNLSYAYNQLIIGDGAIFRGLKTPLEVYQNAYYLDMKGIMVGTKLLNIDPQVFRRSSSGYGGMVIDSGATSSYLPRAAYEILKEEVITVIGSSWKRMYTNEEDISDDLCYNSVFRNPTGSLPIVKFLFPSAAIELPPNSLFKQRNWLATCMAVKPTKERYPGFIGLMATQNYNVGFDLDDKSLYLDKVDCQTLD